MQPYFFPYMGYFELIKSVDVFVFLNDVQFTRRGWINRNKIRSKDKQFDNIIVPVKKHKQRTNINLIEVYSNEWNDLLLKKIIFTYGKNNKENVFCYLKSLKNYNMLKDVLCSSIIWTSRRLGIKTQFENSENISLKNGVFKIIDICKHFNCKHYFNLCNGASIYSQKQFDDYNISLNFMKLTEFHNKLSILDIIMTNEKEAKLWLEKF